MSTGNPTDYIIGDAKRQALTAAFTDMVTKNPGYYRNFLTTYYLADSYNKAALTSLSADAKNQTDPKKLDRIKQILAGSTGSGSTKSTDLNAFAQWIASRFIPHALGTKDQQPKLEQPVVMLERVSDKNTSFYRVFGGKAKSTGNWWMEESDLTPMVNAARQMAGRPGVGDWKSLVRQFMLTSAFVYKEWNDGLQVARMQVPAGIRLPLLVARGSWRTLAEAARPDTKKPDKATEYEKQERVLQNGMMPRSGLKQWYVPVFDTKWITELPNDSAHWPYY